ncbi:hypothetical protein DIURU_002491 [Diutina rugosa]|uniref:Structural maintenance of chromosomes protein n=1 Tax=Diutina rugosa TaxID=5481 RepID=A0A642UQF9_DIURU|nr:uncharacterized protein DIURU_002491 [Diutina rugosa]KAA8903329.1 hypothetical protein DIURU_002491 [Diutina rugosa]
MGRLRGLELENFKSYRGHTSIGLGTSNFISIVGPNGAGKSNMMDAISFVFGVQSQHLRSSNVRDLIYRGRLSDDGDNGDDPTSASVTAHYEKDDGTQIKLQRIISGSSSEYRINDNVVSAKRYLEVLSGENILVSARNFLVFQGDVESVASRPPSELAQWLETVSGSAEFRQRYDELKEELEKAQEVSASAFNRKRTMNHESRQYREQMAEQKQFEQHLAAKNDAIVMLYLYKLYHNEQRHQQLVESKDQHQSRIDEAAESAQVAEAKYKEAASKYSQQVLVIADRAEELKRQRQELETRTHDRVPIDANKKSLSRKIHQINNKLGDLEADSERQQKNAADVRRRLVEAERLYEEFEASAAEDANIPPEAIREYENLRQEFLKGDGAELEQEQTQIDGDHQMVMHRMKAIKSQREDLKEKVAELEETVEQQSELNQVKSQIADILSQKKEKNDTRAQLVSTKESIGLRELKLQSDLKETLVKLDEVTSAQRESEAHRRFMENIALLKRLFPGDVLGTVADLLRPTQQKWDVALATVIGAQAKSVVVKSAATAYKAVSLLKERRLGSMTFIPLDSLVISPVNVSQWRHHPHTTPAVDVVSYDDPKLESVVNYVVSDTLIVETITQATTLKWEDPEHPLRNRLVTAEGAVINSQGYMTGGVPAASATATRVWDAKEITTLTERKEELMADLKELTSRRPSEIQLSQLAEEIAALDEQLTPLRQQKTKAERILQDRQTELEHYRSRIGELEAEITRYQEELDEIDQRREELSGRLASIQEEVYGDFCRKYGFIQIDEYERTTGATLRGRSKEKVGFVRAIAALTKQLNFEEERVSELESRADALREQRDTFEEELNECLKTLEEIDSRLDILSAELEVTEDENKNAAKVQQQLLKQSKQAETEWREYTEELAAAEAAVAEVDDSINATDIQRVSLLKNAKLENVNIPLEDGELTDYLNGDGSLEDLAGDAYDFVIDYEDLPDDLKEEDYSLKHEATLQAKVESIAEALEKLTPNAKARDRLKEVEAKLRNFDADHGKARQKERRIRQQFEAVKQERTDRFMEAFNVISANIDPIYKELASVDGVGGQAYLTVENDDEPYLGEVKFHAMPPMKRFKDMELLSGGEKTMAALALVFAIQSWRPAPFFVLDEIDAALDNENVGRIAKYIREHAGVDVQFIVISLKPQFYDKSEALVGIYREQEVHSSKTATIDLREYETAAAA